MGAGIIAILCVDADPDRPEYGGVRYDCRDKLSWRQLPELASKIATLRKSLLEKFGVRLRVTWFIRADQQIKEIHGDAGWSIREFGDIWKDLSRAGDELAWHPHAWRWSDIRKCWYNETVDANYIVESYKAGFDAFREALRFSPAASRAGINFHNNRSMAELDALGVKLDLSAHPGLSLHYADPDLGDPIEEGFDWTRTPVEPYRPSRDDFQRPSEIGNSLKILEIPMTVWRRSPDSLDYWKGLLPVKIHNGFAAVRPAVKGWFIPNVWGDPFRFQLGLKDVFLRAESRVRTHYASYMHPDDISKTHYQRLTQNLEYMITAATAGDIELQFATATEAYQTFVGES